MTPTDDQPDPDEPRDHDLGSVTGEDLIALRDGDLDEEQERRVREGIERDPEAVAGLLDQLDRTDAILDRIRSQPPPPDLSERLDAVIADEIAARDAARSAGGADDDPPNGDRPDGDQQDRDPDGARDDEGGETGR